MAALRGGGEGGVDLEVHRDLGFWIRMPVRVVPDSNRLVLAEEHLADPVEMASHDFLVVEVTF